MSDIKDQIREFVKDAAERKGVASVTDEESLTANGVIDSLAIFRLVGFLEDTFRVRISDEEIVTENFQSINDIERFVLSKVKPA